MSLQGTVSEQKCPKYWKNKQNKKFRNNIDTVVASRMLSVLETQKENEKKNMQRQTVEAQRCWAVEERAVFRIRKFLCVIICAELQICRRTWILQLWLLFNFKDAVR